MRSATSSSKSEQLSHIWFYPTLFGHNFRRFWPVWFLYLAILMTVPLSILSRSVNLTDSGTYILETLYSCSFLTVCWGLIAAMAVFSYLWNPRASGMIHALPVRREGLFLTNYLSGLGFLLLPHGLTALALALAQSLRGGRVDPLHIVLWFLSISLMALFFYSFAVLCGMFTGNLVALPIFYGILNLLAIVMMSLASSLARYVVWGFDGFAWWVDKLVQWLTPVLKMPTSLVVSVPPLPEGTGPMRGLEVLLLYGLVGLVFTAAALVLYRRRALEQTGNVVTVSWARPIFKYGVAVCTALLLAPSFYAYVFASGNPFSLRGTVSIWRLLPLLILFGLLGYFVAEMLLCKTLRVFQKSWRGALGFSLAMVLLSGGITAAPFSFVRWVPQAEELQAVEFRSYSAPYDAHNGLHTVSDPENIQLLLDLHRTLAEHPTEGGSDPDQGYYEIQEFDLNYVMKNGRSTRRTYTLYLDQSYMEHPDQPGTPAAKLAETLSTPSLVTACYFGLLHEDAQLIRASITPPPLCEDDPEELPLTESTEAAMEEDSVVCPAYNAAYDPFWTGEEELDRLFTAVQKDISEGQLGRRFLADTPERMDLCCHNDLILTFLQLDENGEQYTEDVTITLQSTADDTIRVLKDLGLPFPLVTWNDREI